MIGLRHEPENTPGVDARRVAEAQRLAGHPAAVDQGGAGGTPLSSLDR